MTMVSKRHPKGQTFLRGTILCLMLNLEKDHTWMLDPASTMLEATVHMWIALKITPRIHSKNVSSFYKEGGT